MRARPQQPGAQVWRVEYGLIIPHRRIYDSGFLWYSEVHQTTWTAWCIVPESAIAHARSVLRHEAEEIWHVGTVQPHPMPVRTVQWESHEAAYADLCARYGDTWHYDWTPEEKASWHLLRYPPHKRACQTRSWIEDRDLLLCEDELHADRMIWHASHARLHGWTLEQEYETWNLLQQYLGGYPHDVNRPLVPWVAHAPQRIP